MAEVLINGSKIKNIDKFDEIIDDNLAKTKDLFKIDPSEIREIKHDDSYDILNKYCK